MLEETRRRGRFSQATSPSAVFLKVRVACWRRLVGEGMIGGASQATSPSAVFLKVRVACWGRLVGEGNLIATLIF